MDDLTKLLIGGLIGFVVGIFSRWPLERLAERRAFVRRLTDSYIVGELGVENREKVWTERGATS
jgi:hypothetical protein